jgi:hypothetical protein
MWSIPRSPAQDPPPNVRALTRDYEKSMRDRPVSAYGARESRLRHPRRQDTGAAHTTRLDSAPIGHLRLVIRNGQGRGLHNVSVSCRLSATGIGFSGHPSAAGDSGLPYGRLTGAHRCARAPSGSHVPAPWLTPGGAGQRDSAVTVVRPGPWRLENSVARRTSSVSGVLAQGRRSRIFSELDTAHHAPTAPEVPGRPGGARHGAGPCLVRRP